MQLDLLNLLLVLVAAWAAGKLSIRFGYPAVLGELMAGIILGPPLLGLLHTSPSLEVLAHVGVLMMMLYIGMEIDPRELKRASWGGLLAAIGGFITPFVLAFFLVQAVTEDTMAAIFVGIAAGVTSLATKSRILVDLDLMGTRVAHVMMAGALLADTLALVAFAAILGQGSSGQLGSLDAAALGLVALKAVAWFAVVGLLGTLVLRPAGRWLIERGLATRTATFTLVLIVALAFAELAELAGLHGIVGAFVAGLFLRDQTLGRRLSSQLREVVHDASIGFLAPIFFVTAGFAVSFEAVAGDALLVLALVGLATVGKIAGTALFYLPTGHGWREGLVIGTGMNGRGAVEIILAGIALEMGIIDARIFSMLVVLAIATTATVPVLLSLGVSWLRRRDELVMARDPRTGVIVVGATQPAIALARTLAAEQPVVMIDTNLERCQQARRLGLDALHGDALKEDLIEQAGATRAAMVVAMTGNEAVDTLVARTTRLQFGVPEVFVLQPEERTGHQAVLQHLGIRRVSPELALEADGDTDEVLRRMRGQAPAPA